MKKLICLIMIATLLGSGTWALGSAEVYPEQSRGAYVLGPNDTIEINIVGRKDLDTKQTVTPDGLASLPMLGIIPVQGQTLKGLQKYLTDTYSTYVKDPQITINLTPRPIYVVQYNLKNDIWEVKSAKSVDEANAFAGLDSRFSIEHGNVYKVTMGTKPDFWESNWYKVITATAVMVGIYSTVRK